MSEIAVVDLIMSVKDSSEVNKIKTSINNGTLEQLIRDYILVDSKTNQTSEISVTEVSQRKQEESSIKLKPILNTTPTISKIEVKETQRKRGITGRKRMQRSGG